MNVGPQQHGAMVKTEYHVYTRNWGEGVSPPGHQIKKTVVLWFPKLKLETIFFFLFKNILETLDYKRKSDFIYIYL